MTGIMASHTNVGLMSMDPKTDDTTTVQPTIDYVPSSGAGPPRADVVAGSGVHMSDETRSLLRIRLRAVALAMSCAFGAFLVRDFWLAGHYRDPVLMVFHAGVVAAFLASYAALSGRQPIALGGSGPWSWLCSR